MVCQPSGAIPSEIHRLTVTAGEPTSACGKRRFFVWKKGVNPGEAISIRKPDLYFVAAVAFENRVIGDKPAAGSLWIHGVNL